jgi:hypothetical protein
VVPWPAKLPDPGLTIWASTIWPAIGSAALRGNAFYMYDFGRFAIWATLPPRGRNLWFFAALIGVNLPLRESVREVKASV